MNYNKIEELFFDFILDIIGENLVRENERNNHLTILKKIITEIFEKKTSRLFNPYYGIWIFSNKNLY